MKRLMMFLLTLAMVCAMGMASFAVFDTSRLDQYFEAETQKRIDSMLELVLGKEKAEELVETSRTSSYDFTQVEAYVNQHVAQQSSEMFRLIEAAEQKARDASPEPITPDTCKHNYDLDKVVREEFRNMPIGRDFIKVTYYYVCTKCGDTKTEVETYDA